MNTKEKILHWLGTAGVAIGGLVTITTVPILSSLIPKPVAAGIALVAYIVKQLQVLVQDAPTS